MLKAKNGELIMEWKCAEYGIKNSIIVKEQEAKGKLSSLRVKIPLNKIPLLSSILFWVYKNEWNCEQIFIGRW